MHVGEMVREAARRYGDRPAIVSAERTLSFVEFDRATDRLGNALLGKGLRPADGVGILLPNGIEGLVLSYALAKPGLGRVSPNLRQTDPDHRYNRGARNVVLNRFDPDAVLEALERTRATATFMVPTMLSMLLDHPGMEEAKVNLRRLCYGAAPAAPSLLERAQDVFGPVLANTYGQAEAPMCITCLRPEDHAGRFGSAGKP